MKAWFKDAIYLVTDIFIAIGIVVLIGIAHIVFILRNMVTISKSAFKKWLGFLTTSIFCTDFIPLSMVYFEHI